MLTSTVTMMNTNHRANVFIIVTVDIVSTRRTYVPQDGRERTSLAGTEPAGHPQRWEPRGPAGREVMKRGRQLERMREDKREREDERG